MDDRQFSALRVHADRRKFLIGRARVAAALRAWFAAQGFVEVETSILQVSPGNETHVHAFATELAALGGGKATRYLRTSPEFACKKLISAGERRIVEFARVFRNRERGALHAPEFTMLEWYRAGEPYERLMEDCAAVLAVAAETKLRLDPFHQHAAENVAPVVVLGQADSRGPGGLRKARRIRPLRREACGKIDGRVAAERLRHGEALGGRERVDRPAAK